MEPNQKKIIIFLLVSIFVVFLGVSLVIYFIYREGEQNKNQTNTSSLELTNKGEDQNQTETSPLGLIYRVEKQSEKDAKACPLNKNRHQTPGQAVDTASDAVVKGQPKPSNNWDIKVSLSLSNNDCVYRVSWSLPNWSPFCSVEINDTKRITGKVYCVSA